MEHDHSQNIRIELETLDGDILNEASTDPVVRTDNGLYVLRTGPAESLASIHVRSGSGIIWLLPAAPSRGP